MPLRCYRYSDVHYSDSHYNTCFSGDQEASNDADIPSSLKKRLFKTCSVDCEYSGDPKSGRVRILNGGHLVGSQMVWFSNGFGLVAAKMSVFGMDSHCCMFMGFWRFDTKPTSTVVSRGVHFGFKERDNLATVVEWLSSGDLNNKHFNNGNIVKVQYSDLYSNYRPSTYQTTFDHLNARLVQCVHIPTVFQKIVC